MTTPVTEPRLTLVAAITRNGVIGRDGDLVWRNRADLQRLKARTMGHTLVMGRKNFDSIGRPLPGRRTVVLTRDPHWSHAGVAVAHDAEVGLQLALREIVAETGDPEVFVFGGGEVYRQLIDQCVALELTLIDAEIDGDVSFPRIDLIDWRETAREQHPGFSWVRLDQVTDAERQPAQQ